ncbi:MAG: hypothetical protein K9I95_07950 [Flavobacteriaceae bacterium]|jgi:hypothetical protein|nr:hypothetical protein [Flavobacteriaceae bacterium]
MKTKIFQYLFIFTALAFVNPNSFAQETNLKNYKIRFGLSTTKQADNSRILEASYVAANKKDRKDRVPIYDANINFYNVFADEEVLLGTAKTDQEGIAQLIVPANQSYTTNEEGYINFKAVFDGTDGLDYEEAEVAVKDVFLELNLEDIDSVKTVILNAYTLDSLQTKIPLEETEIIFSVGGMLSKMPIKQDNISEGRFEFEFPEHISGDKNGNIDVFASIIDNDEYGNVIQKKNIAWGINKNIITESNQLWSDVAPIWMYVVLSILLIGVWANYAYSIKNLFNIKKEGKELELKSENEN